MKAHRLKSNTSYKPIKGIAKLNKRYKHDIN